MSLYIDYDDDSDLDNGDFEDDYIWAEAGGWGLADELASGAIPDPPALYYREDELDEYDNYNFWSELEYGNGEMHDGEESVEDAAQDDAKSRDKKKKSKADHLKDTIRKIRLQGIQEFPAVMWKPCQEAFSLRSSCPAYQKPQKTTALLPNWREYFKDRPYVAITLPLKEFTHRRKNKEQDGQEERGDWEDMSVEGEDDDDDDDEDEDEQGEDEEDGEAMDMQDIDPDLLKTALAAKLSGSGLTAADQAAFMESLMHMVATGGGGDMDRLLEGLTSTLLNKATEGGTDSSTAQWLSGQGVSLDENGHEEEEEEEEEEVEKDTTTTSTPAILPAGTSAIPSPKDSVASDLRAAPQISLSSSKDLRQTATKTAGQKRKQASLETANHLASPPPETTVLESAGPSSKRSKRATATAQTGTATSARDKAATTANSTRSQSKGEKSKNTAPATTGKESSSTVEPTKPTTRKRKATTEQVPEEKPKRQMRNFAAPTTSSQSKTAEAKTTSSQSETAEVKTTRSGRVRK